MVEIGAIRIPRYHVIVQRLYFVGWRSIGTAGMTPPPGRERERERERERGSLLITMCSKKQ